jgi:hypothetical protein
MSTCGNSFAVLTNARSIHLHIRAHTPTHTHTHTHTPSAVPCRFCDSRRARGCDGPSLPRDAQHGGFHHLGRLLQDQAQGHEVQRRPRRLRPLAGMRRRKRRRRPAAVAAMAAAEENGEKQEQEQEQERRERRERRRRRRKITGQGRENHLGVNFSKKEIHLG